MPTLSLRSVGMSYLIEGLGPAALRSAQLHASLSDQYGPAVAVMGELDAHSGAPEALILDRRAVSWTPLCEQLSTWVQDQGCACTGWSEQDPTPGRRATLRYELS